LCDEYTYILINLGFLAISGLERCTALTRLDLSRNKISVIMGLDCLENLQRLNLSYNQISSVSGGLSDNTNLEWLDLKANQISRLDDLKELEQLESLSVLHLRDEMGKDANPVCTDENYITFMQKSLKKLNILDGGHLILVDCVKDMEERMQAMKPDESLAHTPREEAWFDQQSGLDAEGDNDDISSGSKPAFACVDDAAEAIKSMVGAEGSHLLKKASNAISKTHTL
jgi:hypothetical protein